MHGLKNNSMTSRVLLLTIGSVLLYLFVAVGLPFFSGLTGPSFQASHQTIIEEDIDAGEWFYIFVPQIREIEPRVRHTMEYTPHYKPGMEKEDI